MDKKVIAHSEKIRLIKIISLRLFVSWWIIPLLFTISFPILYLFFGKNTWYDILDIIKIYWYVSEEKIFDITPLVNTKNLPVLEKECIYYTAITDVNNKVIYDFRIVINDT